MQQRADPDCWDLVGGHVEQDESPDRAVVRECREEQEHDDLRWFAAEELVGLTLAHPATLSCLLETLRPDDHV